MRQLSWLDFNPFFLYALWLSMVFLFIATSIFAQNNPTLTITLAAQNQRLVIADSKLDSAHYSYSTLAQNQLLQEIDTAFVLLDSAMRHPDRLCFFCKKDLLGIQKSFNEREFNTYKWLTQEDQTGLDWAENLPFNPRAEGLENLDEFMFTIFNLFNRHLWKGKPLKLHHISPDIFDSLIVDLLDTVITDFELEFQLEPPVRLNDFHILWKGQDTLTYRQKKQILKDLDGALWYEELIKARIIRYYDLLNYTFSLEVEGNTAKVYPAKIVYIAATVEAKKDSTKEKQAVDKAMYYLLPHDFYKKYLNIPMKELKGSTVSEGAAFYGLNLAKKWELPYDSLPILDGNRLQVQQMQLNQLDYSLNVSPYQNTSVLSEANSGQAQAIRKFSVHQRFDNKDTTNVKQAIHKPTTEGMVDANHNENHLGRAFGDSEHNLRDSTKINKKRPNYITFSSSWTVDNEVVLEATYQRIMPNHSIFSAQIGYTFLQGKFSEGGFIASGNFFQDFIFFNALKKRMSVLINANSKFTVNRILSNEPFVERRRTGKLRFELDWFRDWKGHFLQSAAGFQVQQIQAMAKNSDEIIGGRLDFIDLETTWYYKKDKPQFSNRFLLESNLKTGRYLEQNDSTTWQPYWKSSIKININQSLSRGFAIDLTGHWQFSSNVVPEWEQTALKTNLNRGFIDDAVIGRQFFGIQAEVWLPFPTFGNKFGRFNQYLYKHLRLAPFADISYFRNTNILQEGYWSSPGMGIRYLIYPAQVNFDFVPIGFLPNKLGNEKGRFSLNLILNLK